MTSPEELLWRFSDEDLAQVGITREEWLDPHKRDELMARLRDQADDELRQQEEGIEHMVAAATEAIGMFPDSRIDQLARFEGDAWQMIKDATPEEEQQDLLRSDQFIHLLLLAVFKLAEAGRHE